MPKQPVRGIFVSVVESKATRRVVTQAEIKGLCDLKAEVARQAAELEAKVREGYDVEPGDYYAKVETKMTKQGMTKTFLTQKLGKEAAEGLWGQLGEKPSESFKFGVKAEEAKPAS